jgi:hypothetical protein
MSVISFLACHPVSGVAIAVDSQVAPLAGGNYVGGVHADGVTVAQVGNGEYDAAPGPSCGLMVGLYTAAQAWVRAVHPTLARAFTAGFGSSVADRAGESVPTGRVVLRGHGHGGASLAGAGGRGSPSGVLVV